MTSVFALFGKSCVGKSEIADRLAQRLYLPVRHCGEIVKDRASQLGLSTSNLPAAEHTEIDSATRRIVADCDGRLAVEGTFLNIVLRGLPNVTFVHLTCEDEERVRRFVSRHSDRSGDLHLRDEADDLMRRGLYGETQETSESALHIDTTRFTADEAASLIIRSCET